jgi:hypothetical protein
MNGEGRAPIGGPATQPLPDATRADTSLTDRADNQAQVARRVVRCLTANDSGLPPLRRRATAARRLPTWHGGQNEHLGDVDPDARWWPVGTSRPVGTHTYGLTEPELVAEARRQRAAGWQPWELHQRLPRPS